MLRRLTKSLNGFGRPVRSSTDTCFCKQLFADDHVVETGTCYGETTELLSTFANKVYTIEPEPSLFSRAKQKFSDNPRVTVINQLSETALPELLPLVDGDVYFWLDGHYSGGDTFAGPNDTPLVHELNEISRHVSRL